MKREIKFRGKSTDTGKWIYGFLSFFYTAGRGENRLILTGKAKIYSPEDCRCDDVWAETVGQYIGLPDKNGKEAYIGDIIRFTPKVLNIIGSDYVKTDYELLAIIDTDKYNHSILCILHDKGRFKKGEFYHIEGVLNGEIIGNQYDNHELLED